MQSEHMHALAAMVQCMASTDHNGSETDFKLAGFLLVVLTRVSSRFPLKDSLALLSLATV